MRLKLRYCGPLLLHVASVLFAVSPSLAASWQNGVDYGGSGPTMDLYVPDNPEQPPGIVVALHYCGGSSGNVHSWFQSLADQYGFLIIAPDVGPGDCWNATPERSGEPAAIVQMVDFTIGEYQGDPTRVFSAGASSGACMTNALLAAYPDVFAAGSVLAGVPAGAWTGGNSCSICGQNPPNRTAEQWGDIVRNAYSFSGERPRVQLFHGTNDTTLNYPGELDAEVAQWTNVFGVSDADATMENDTPKSGWTRTSYKDGTDAVVLEVNIGQGQQHDLTGQGLYPDIVRFFGLDQDAAPGGGMGGAGSGGGSASGGAGGVASGGSATGGAGGLTSGGGANGGGAGASAGGSENAGTGGSATESGASGTGGVEATAGGSANGGARGMAIGGGGANGGGSGPGGANTGGATSGATAGASNVATSSGGALSSSGGSGTPNANATSVPPDSGGCSCRVVGPRRPLGALAWSVAGLFVGAGMLRRRRRRLTTFRRSHHTRGIQRGTFLL